MYKDSFTSIGLRALPQCNTLTIRIYFGIYTINYLLFKSYRTGSMDNVVHNFTTFNYASSAAPRKSKQAYMTLSFHATTITSSCKHG